MSEPLLQVEGLSKVFPSRKRIGLFARPHHCHLVAKDS